MLPLFARELEPVSIGFWRPLLQQLDEMLVETSRERERRDAQAAAFVPRYAADETDQHYVMSIDVPGVHRDDLVVEVTGSRLRVSGERRSERGSAARAGSSFQCEFALPEGVNADAIVAEHKDGVLRLAVEKPATARTTRVRIADGSALNREGGFFKSLVGSRKSPNPVAVNGATVKNEPAAMPN